ncbi:hypothetical protein KVT40_000527 [Elsinoe batatas]|uniref:Uncharacterized protein n=1 Tax=Elsinoe batatas TaxID=2601811 RepID=A0A8K0L8Y3_9PEZI|nr:hypothetical protein KVT40_000527 [Elsinoe batatas]
MPSNLRLQLDVQSTQSYYPHTASASSPQQKSKMSLTQTYRIASTARGKLGMEASRADHNLRLLVGHANFLDSLMLELANAEREQEAWFNDTIRTANRGEAPKHIQWFDSIAEEDEAYDDSDSDSDSDIDVNDFAIPPRRRSVSPPPSNNPIYYDDEEEVEDYDEDEELALTRVPSHSTPELVHEDSDSEDESMPPSPSHSTIEFDEKTAAAIGQSELYPKAVAHLKAEVVSEDFLQQTPTMIPAY